MKHIEILQGQRESTEVTVDITCDICGKSCWFEHGGYSFAEFRAHWGYASNHDRENWNCELCENCAEKIRDFIKKTGGKVRVQNYI